MSIAPGDARIHLNLGMLAFQEGQLEQAETALDPLMVQQYRARFPDDAAATNLSNWALFEGENPKTFVGMYNFWVQKPRT
jgi:hypothetical protein